MSDFHTQHPTKSQKPESKPQQPDSPVVEQIQAIGGRHAFQQRILQLQRTIGNRATRHLIQRDMNGEMHDNMVKMETHTATADVSSGQAITAMGPAPIIGQMVFSNIKFDSGKYDSGYPGSASFKSDPNAAGNSSETTPAPNPAAPAPTTENSDMGTA